MLEELNKLKNENKIKHLLAGFPLSKRVLSAKIVSGGLAKSRKNSNINLGQMQRDHINTNSRNDKIYFTQASSQPSQPVTTVQNSSHISTADLTPLLGPQKLLKEHSNCKVQKEVSYHTKSGCLIKNLKLSGRTIKSLKANDHNAVLDFNKSFSKTFMVLFQYLKMTCKIPIPPGLYTSYKSGLFGECKHQAEELFKLFTDSENLTKLSELKKCVKHMIFLLNCKISYKCEDKVKNNKLMEKFLMLDNKYSFLMDKVLCQKTFDNRKCSTSRANGNKLHNSIKPKFLKRIQVLESAPTSCRQNEEVQNLDDLKNKINDFIKPLSTNRDCVLTSRIHLNAKIRSRIKNAYNSKISLRSSSVNSKKEKAKVTPRLSSSLININQETQKFINSVIPANTESVTLKNAADNLIKVYY